MRWFDPNEPNKVLGNQLSEITMNVGDARTLEAVVVSLTTEGGIKNRPVLEKMTYKLMSPNPGAVLVVDGVTYPSTADDKPPEPFLATVLAQEEKEDGSDLRVIANYVVTFKDERIKSNCSANVEIKIDPMLPATIRARAHQVSRSDTSCNTIAASATYEGASFTLVPAATPPTAQTQTAGSSSYVSWSGSPTTYTLGVSPTNTDLSFANACSTTTGGAPYAQGLSAAVSPRQTLTWEVGLSPPGPWVQTGGGNVMVGGALTSLIPTTTTPRLFALSGTGGFPGLVTYGSSYDVDPDPVGKGASLVSSTNWLAQDTVSGTNYYEYFRNKFGLKDATTNDNGSFNLDALGKPASREKPYHFVGDVTTAGTWTIGDSESIIVVIDGALTINGPITISGSGLIAFIVQGNISISPAVGGPASSQTPVLEGIYVTGGTFATGGGSLRLVGKGSFIANSFSLERDLGDTGNQTYAAELFQYNPRLFLNLPNSMKEHAVTWQEVAP